MITSFLVQVGRLRRVKAMAFCHAGYVLCFLLLCSYSALCEITSGVGSPTWRAFYGAEGLLGAEDSDGDGTSNSDEAIAGTNPFDPSHSLQVKLVTYDKQSRLVTWRSEPGRMYQLLTSQGEDYSPWSGDFVGDGELIHALVPPGTFNRALYSLEPGLIGEQRGRLIGLDELIDSDGDGQPDFEEFLLGSDPSDPESKRWLIDQGYKETLTLSWTSQLGKIYQVERSSVLVGGKWQPVGKSLMGTGDWICKVCVGDGQSKRSFYRIAVEDADSDGDGMSDWDELVLETDPMRGETTIPDPEVQARKLTIGLSRGTVWLDHDTSGAFRLVREGMLGPEAYELIAGGSAVPGLDYEPLPQVVAFGTGQRVLEVDVRPLATGLAAGEFKTVSLQVTGNERRTVRQSEFPEVRIISKASISVADYGAVGDGLTDDTLAIRNAVAALEQNPQINTLWFPTGRYRLVVPGYGTSAGRCLIRLGRETIPYTDLLGRDLLLAGEPGAVIYADTGTVLSHTLRVHSSFRSLAFRGLTIEKSPNPRKFNTRTEPNGSDGITLTDYNGAKVAEISMVDCRFVNCHCAVRTFVYGLSRWGNLQVFRMERCVVDNPYGANTTDDVPLYGGGQQIQLNSWMAYASYEDNVFDGGGDGVTGDYNPCGARKDGSHFGAPLELRFVRNQVRNMGVEAVYQTNTREVGSVTTAFVAPTLGDDPLPVFVSGGHDSHFQPGQHLNFRAYPGGVSPVNVVLRVISHDFAGRMLMLDNDGAGSSSYGQLTVNAGTGISLQEAAPTRATIWNNVITGGERIGLAGVAVNAKSKISGNFIHGYNDGVRVYDEVRTPLNPAARGTWIFDNLIVPFYANPNPAYYVYGIQSWGPEASIFHNEIIIQRSVRAIGISTRGEGDWILGNVISALEKISNGYGSSERALGIAIGDWASLSRARGNFTRGFDVGIGPGATYLTIPYYVRDHYSIDDDLPVDPRGMIAE